jgi:hypothetical protein
VILPEVISEPACRALTAALLDLAEDGGWTPCQRNLAEGGEDLWWSDDRAARERAAELCAGCPVLGLCGAAADEAGERHGVWAGVDRQRRRARSSA